MAYQGVHPHHRAACSACLGRMTCLLEPVRLCAALYPPQNKINPSATKRINQPCRCGVVWSLGTARAAENAAVPHVCGLCQSGGSNLGVSHSCRNGYSADCTSFLASYLLQAFLCRLWERSRVGRSLLPCLYTPSPLSQIFQVTSRNMRCLQSQECSTGLTEPGNNSMSSIQGVCQKCIHWQPWIRCHRALRPRSHVLPCLGSAQSNNTKCASPGRKVILPEGLHMGPCAPVLGTEALNQRRSQRLTERAPCNKLSKVISERVLSSNALCHLLHEG